MLMETDVIIVGGGPAGLGMARALAGTGLNLTLVERQPHESLSNPAYDGREIALTHRSIATLQELGAWSRIADADRSPLREARVLNGGVTRGLTFDAGPGAHSQLGMLVPNSAIRRSLFESAVGQEGLTLLTDVNVAAARTNARGATVTLTDGRELRGRLLIAADSRLSSVRRQLGIEAEMNRLGRAMLVCRVAHELDHGQIATEWFDVPHTIAMLPLNGRMSSAVITLPQAEAERLARESDEALGAAITAMYRGRLGGMQVASSRHVYPLVTTFARRFIAPSAALVGDTAVGMHPVTAHGFNLGLQSAVTLAARISAARRRGDDWAGADMLRDYETAHRMASRPLYTATNLLVRLYGDSRPVARLARHAVLQAGRRMPLVRSAVSAMLMQR